MARRYHRRFVHLVDRLGAGPVPEATNLIVTGRVKVNGLIVTNPNTLIPADAVVTLVSDRVLRGTTKMRLALVTLAATISGRVCLDAGAAAGGFTAALLEAGARCVYAVDVGFGQLVSGLRQDRRVINLERTNLAALTPALVGEPVEVISLDLSYLAVADALPQLSALELADGAQLIALVKPAFELRAGGVIDDDEAIDKAVATASAAAESCGWSVRETTVPVFGAGGAREVFIYGRR